MNVERKKVGPRLSQAVVHGETVYLAGIVADHPVPEVAAQTGQILEMLLQRVEVGERLAGMGEVSEAVDHRTRGVVGELFDRGVALGPHDDNVDHLA